MRRERHNQKKQHKNITPDLISSMLVDNQNSDYLIRLSEKAESLERKLINDTYIIYGPSSVGKCGMIYWALRNDSKTKIVKIDCEFHKSENCFIEEMTEEMGIILEKREEICRKIVMANEEICFGELNSYIKKSKYKFVFLIKNAERLTDVRKQLVLYNILQWMKTDIRDHIGLVFVTKSVSFFEKLEKRIKSRLNAKSLYIGPPNHQTIKAIIQRRLQVLKDEQKHKEERNAVGKICDIIKNGKNLDKIIKKQTQKIPKNIIFFLELFKLMFALSFSHQPQSVYHHSASQLQEMLCSNYEEALKALHPYIKKQQTFLKNANYPEYTVMCVIKHMMECEKIQITPKLINSEFCSLTNPEKLGGSSFSFSSNLIDLAIKKLVKLKILSLDGEGNGFQNAEITSHMTPEAIRQAIESIEHLPQLIKGILNS